MLTIKQTTFLYQQTDEENRHVIIRTKSSYQQTSEKIFISTYRQNLHINKQINEVFMTMV